MRLRTVLGVAGVTVLVLLLAGNVLGQPVLLSYVETGSMEPTMEAGDGFVAVPAAVAGPVQPGDVVVFEADTLNGGGLTTHRVVDETPHGYVTRGDANPFTDQAGGEPHVTEGQVVAVALRVDGEVVTVPHLGTAVMTVRGTTGDARSRLEGHLGTDAPFGANGPATLLLVAGVGVLLFDWATGGGRRPDRDRSWSRFRGGGYDAGRLVVLFALLVGVFAVGTMATTSGTYDQGIVSAEYESDRADVIPTGETTSANVTLSNGGVIPMVTVVEPASDGVDVDPDRRYLGPRESGNVTLSVTAPPETGYYLRSVEEYRYFAVLPGEVLLALHGVHPWLAGSAATMVVVVGFTLPLVLVVGVDGRIRVRERTREAGGPR